jgi:hypothetical protein
VRRGPPALDAEAEGRGLRPRRDNGSEGRRGEVDGDAAGGGAAEDGDGWRRHGRGLAAKRDGRRRDQTRDTLAPFWARSGVWWPAKPARRCYHVATWPLTVATSAPATLDRRIHGWLIACFRASGSTGQAANGNRRIERAPASVLGGPCGGSQMSGNLVVEV